MSDGAEWWGGRLADGSLIVLSPGIEEFMVADSSSTTGLQPKPHKKKAHSLKDWLGIRTGIPFPYNRGHSIGLRRGTLILAIALLVGEVIPVNWFIEKRLGLSSATFLGGSAFFLSGLVASTAVLTLIYFIEVAPLKRAGMEFLDIEDSDDDYLRYVHPKIVETREWESLEEAAKKHPPPGEKAHEVHLLMWEAAGITATLDAHEILPADRDRLSEMALQARGL